MNSKAAQLRENGTEIVRLFARDPIMNNTNFDSANAPRNMGDQVAEFVIEKGGSAKEADTLIR